MPSIVYWKVKPSSDINVGLCSVMVEPRLRLRIVSNSTIREAVPRYTVFDTYNVMLLDGGSESHLCPATSGLTSSRPPSQLRYHAPIRP